MKNSFRKQKNKYVENTVKKLRETENRKASIVVSEKE